jgi:uncharacterized protein (TIGR03066 family)
VLMVCGLAISGSAGDRPDNTKLIMGKWEVTKGDKSNFPVGCVFEFDKGAKLKFIAKEDGKEEDFEGTYKVEGSELQLALKYGKKERKLPLLVIKKISEKELVLAPKAGKGDAIELKRIK